MITILSDLFLYINWEIFSIPLERGKIWGYRKFHSGIIDYSNETDENRQHAGLSWLTCTSLTLSRLWYLPLATPPDGLCPRPAGNNASVLDTWKVTDQSLLNEPIWSGPKKDDLNSCYNAVTQPFTRLKSTAIMHLFHSVDLSYVKLSVTKCHAPKTHCSSFVLLCHRLRPLKIDGPTSSPKISK